MDNITDTISSNVSDIASQPAHEGERTKSVERVTAKIPSLGYMGIAMASLAVAAGLASFSQKKWLANFVGQWVPTFLLLGIYNKMVKQQGSDQQTLH